MRKIIFKIFIISIFLFFISCSYEPTKSETSLEEFIYQKNYENTESQNTKEIISETNNPTNTVHITPTSTPTPIPTVTPSPTETPTPIPEYKVNLIAVGDNLIHSMIIKSGKQKDGTYDFNYMYEHILENINEGDIKVLNQETMFVNDSSKYSGYPTFGSPIKIGEATINAGFNVFTLATNHSYDKKQEGIIDTINFYKSKENITYLGLHESEEDRNKIKIETYNNISFAMLNYTYGLNGFKKPTDKQYLIDTFMTEEEINLFLEQIKEASMLADFVIIYIHMGTEYTHKPTANQKDMFKKIANAGADLIIGTHPHVIEPLEIIETEDNRIVPIYYSLGNFISNQDKLNTMLGAMAKVSFIKKGDSCYIDSFDMEPIVTHISNKQTNFQVFMLKDYSEELIKEHKLYSKGLTLDYLNNLWTEIYSISKIENK